MAQIQKKFIASNAVDETKIRLSNNAALRARNAANSGDINILKVNASDKVEFASVPQATSDASSGNDLVRYSQVSALLDGMKPKRAVAVASTGNIDLSVAADPSPIDGHTLANGDRILLWQQTASAENGIYDAVTAADPTTWTRSSDFNASSEIPGSYTVSEFGTLYQGVLFVCLSSPTTIGTDAIDFSMRTITVSTYTGGDMISLSAGAFSVDLATTSGLESTNPGNAAGQLRVKLEASNPSLQIDGSNQLGAKLDGAGAITSGASGLKANTDGSTLEINTNALRVKDAGITLAKLASDSVDENKIVSTTMSATGAIAGGSGTKLSVNTDGSTVDINSNALRVKPAGITETQLASSALSSTGGLAGGSGTKVSVNVDSSTIEINTNTLRVKDAGITLAKLASDSVDENKIVSTTISTTGALNGGSGTKLSSRVDASTVKINGSNNLEALKANEEHITLSGTDITNQYIDLAYAAYGTSASVNSLCLTVAGGIEQVKTVDYTVSLTGGSGSVTRVTFAGDLATGGAAALVSGDILMVKYSYLT